jgi:putative endonuclease
MKLCTYILFSEKLNKFYIGSTTDIGRRLIEHNRGKEKFTKTGIPWIIVYLEEFEELINARKRETLIKKQKSRKFIESLISKKRIGIPIFNREGHWFESNLVHNKWLFRNERPFFMTFPNMHFPIF